MLTNPKRGKAMPDSQKAGRPANTGRDKEILDRLAAGESTAAVAKEFSISPARIRGIRANGRAVLDAAAEDSARQQRIAAEIDREKAYTAGYNAAIADLSNATWLAGWDAAVRKHSRQTRLKVTEIKSCSDPAYHRDRQKLKNEIAAIQADHDQRKAAATA